MAKFVFDPTQLPVTSLAGEAPVAPARLIPAALRARFAQTLPWEEEVSDEGRGMTGATLRRAAVLVPLVARPEGVTVLKQGFNVDPLLQKQAACISTMTYNEYWQVIDAGIAEDDLVTFKYEDQGVATLEDGLYVLEETLEDSEKVTDLVGFVRASMRGWQYAAENPEEAAQIVLDNDETGAQTLEHQTRMMTEIAKLLEGSDGTLAEADYQRTVDILLSGGSDPVIQAAPEGAWVSTITDRAFD